MKTPESLFYENSRFSKFILKKHFPKLLFDEDIQQVADLGLWKACINYDQASETKFTTFAGVVIYNEVLMELRDRRKIDQFYCISLSQNITDMDDDNLTYRDLIKDPKGEEFIDFVLCKDTIEESMQRLNNIEKEVLLYRVQGKKHREIASLVGLSQSYVSKILYKVRKKVKV